MAYKIKFENGHTVSFDSEPSESDIDEAFAHTQTLGSKKEQPLTEDSMYADRQRQIIPDLVKNVGGLIDTGAGMLAGMPANIYGGLRGASSILAGEGVDTAVKRLEDARTSNFGFGEYKPVSKSGAEYSESIGKALNKPVEIAGDVGESLLGNEGRFVGELLAGSAMELLDPLVPFAIAKGGMKKFSSKTSKPVETPKLDNIEKRLEAMVKRDPSNPATGPITDTRTGAQLSKEAYDAALREKELQRTSAFNRPDQFPDMVQESPMDRMVRDLGGEPSIPATPDSVMGRMADDLTTDRSTSDQRAAQDLIEQRQAQLEQDMRIRATPELQAAERARQEQAPVVSPEHQKLMDDMEAMQQAQREQEALQLEQARQAEEAQRQAEAQQAIEARNAALEADVATARAKDEAITNVAHRRMGPEDATRSGSILDNFKNSKISGKGLGRQRGAIDPDLFKLRFPEFGRSKIVDDSGKLKPLIRGVRNDYAYPERTSLGKFGKGVYLTEAPELSNIFAGKSGNTRQAYVNMVQPYEISMADDIAYRTALSRSSIAAEEFAQKLRTLGHDGIILRDKDGAIREAVVFDPENVKNAFTLPKKPLSLKDRPIGQRGPANSQTGAIMLPFGKKPAVDQLKKIEGIKNDPQMRNIFPEKLSVEEVIKEHAALKTPDVDQNGLQKLMNHLTKGSLYQAIKTDNPIVRVVGEKIRQANNYAMEATGRLVHDGLAPLAQKLSKKEKADVWAVQQMAEAKGVTLTPEFLREEGFNQKQIDWVTEHKSVMDDMYSRMSDSMKAAGLEPVSARVAYVASRARGDFRRLIMKDNKVVGIMGDNTRMGLNKQIERLKKDHPEYEIGQERYYGGRAAKGTEEGFMQMLDFLSKDNPDFKLFVNHVNDMLSQDAFQYMNAKSHTMQKKRIEGMEGRKLYADAVKNAEEGMQAQIRYAETMIKWSELSKAIAEIKPLLKQDNGLDMPNAKEWANEYIQGALGNSPGKLGDALDSVTAAIGKGTGIGTTIPARTVSAMKSYVNGVLLGFGNVGFLTANALQLPRTMPEMAAWLNTKGIEAGYDLGLGRALITVQKQLFNSKLTDLERGAFEYAKKNHVYSSNLFESGNTVSKGLSYYWQKGTQMIASPLERETRKVAFFAYTHMLDEAGIKPSDGLYEAAQNLTDMHMNNYAQAEAPRVYQETGGIGRSAYNLMSFKHNELSRLAMFAREIPNGQGKPILTAMASQVAFAGLIGTLGFAEADAMYEWLTAKMGEPTSLTKILLDNPEIPDALKFGMGSLADVDLTNRMGLQLTPGSMIDLVAPGFGKLGDIGGAVGEMVSQPNLYNAANVAREALPLSVGGIMDRTIFETEDGMALNRNKVSASAVRNDADKLWKALGMTGVNESVQKKLSYENQKIDQVYKDKRSKVIDGAIKEYYMRGVMPDNWVERYIELQGDPKEAKAAIQARIEALNVDRPTKELMQNAASKSISSQHKLLRRLGME